MGNDEFEWAFNESGIPNPLESDLGGMPDVDDQTVENMLDGVQPKEDSVMAQTGQEVPGIGLGAVATGAQEQVKSPVGGAEPHPQEQGSPLKVGQGRVESHVVGQGGLQQPASQRVASQRPPVQGNPGVSQQSRGMNGQVVQKGVNGQGRPAAVPGQRKPQVVKSGAGVASSGGGKKKFPVVPVVAAVMVMVVLVGIMAVVFRKKEEPPQELIYVYETSGKYAMDSLRNALRTYDATTVDKTVGIADGDSYLAQEWAYVNGVALREEFITKVCALVDFKYPMIQRVTVDGVGLQDAEGNPLMMESFMNNGESVVAVIPDYAKLSVTMDEEVEYITRLYESSGYKPTDYTWHDELANLLLQYLCDKQELPVKEVELTFNVAMKDGVPYVVSDAELDQLLFSSDEFHEMCDKFSRLGSGWTGLKEEEYVTQEAQHNPEYDEWLVLFNQYYEADKGVFNKKTSKWEPWYLRDDDNNYILDEEGNRIVNYYSIKDKDGNDWIEPDKIKMVDVVKTHQVEDPWYEERGIMYNWIGTYWVQNLYTGEGDTSVRVGDGTKDRPAGVGTTIITKVKDTKGKYRDVRVAVTGYWTRQDAIDYAEQFSEKNRGFTSAAVVQLICYEVQIENLEDKTIEFTSEMTLCDSNSNVSARTGTLYGFTETVKLKPGEKVVINDWATSTELQQKYVCWGKSFGREYSKVYFDILAGAGNIPSYSAYKAFTGKGTLQ